ncbi:MAG: hypothetical protein PHV37_03045 [Candidatus Gastranaerophilales bacterium]|nr:hypothetical protein [Candidatus Gastranaerophilales bacterium]
MVKLYTKTIQEKHTKYEVCGMRFSIKNKEYCNKLAAELEKEKELQNNFDIDSLKNAKKLILFLTPGGIKINGGILSIFSLCTTSRELNKDAVCILSTYPNDKYTYAYNDKFPNNEQIYRFSQIIENCKNLEEIIVHIPDYYAMSFYKALNKNELIFFKSIKNVQLNIMNQNIENMPEVKKLKSLYLISNNVTQTVAHDRYATQEVCNKFKMPTHLFSVEIDYTLYKKYPFEKKEKIIVLSPDDNKNKSKIVQSLEKEFPDWKIITVNNMSFFEYMDLISRAYFTITFGEGMDGYFNQPAYVDSLGFAVYNDHFFPNKEWKDLNNVYSSYTDMTENLPNDLKKLYENKELYYKTINEHFEKLNITYQKEKFVSNLRNFYFKKYDFLPQD